MELPKNLDARYSMMSTEDTAAGMMGSKEAANIIQNLPEAALKGGRPGYLNVDVKETGLRPGLISWGEDGPRFVGKGINAAAQQLNTQDLYAALEKKHSIQVKGATAAESAAIVQAVNKEVKVLETPAPAPAAMKAAEKAAEGSAVAKAAEGALAGLGEMGVNMETAKKAGCVLVCAAAGAALMLMAIKKGYIVA